MSSLRETDYQIFVERSTQVGHVDCQGEVITEAGLLLSMAQGPPYAWREGIVGCRGIFEVTLA